MCRNYNVCIIPAVVAVILGIVVGALFFAGTIVAGTIAIPVVAGLIFATVTYILLFNIAAFGKRQETKECICDYGKCLIPGIFITIVTGFLALTFLDALAAGAIVSALLIGIFGFGLVLNFLSFVGLLVCLVRKNCYRKDMNNMCCKFENN